MTAALVFSITRTRGTSPTQPPHKHLYSGSKGIRGGSGSSAGIEGGGGGIFSRWRAIIVNRLGGSGGGSVRIHPASFTPITPRTLESGGQRMGGEAVGGAPHRVPENSPSINDSGSGSGSDSSSGGARCSSSSRGGNTVMNPLAGASATGTLATSTTTATAADTVTRRDIFLDLAMASVRPAQQPPPTVWSPAKPHSALPPPLTGVVWPPSMRLLPLHLLGGGAASTTPPQAPVETTHPPGAAAAATTTVSAALSLSLSVPPQPRMGSGGKGTPTTYREGKEESPPPATLIDWRLMQFFTVATKAERWYFAQVREGRREERG